MMQKKHQTAYILSAVVGLLMLVQSLGGLFIDGLYRDNAFVQCAWHGNDQVTLLLALPLLLGSLLFAWRGSDRAHLVLMGTLAYTVYNYGFYAFGAVLNDFFLIFVALFALALLALVFGLARLDADRIGRSFQNPTPVKWVGSYMYLWAVLLSALWITQSLQFVFTGIPPAIVTATAHPTNVTAVLDLSLMVPPVFLGAFWLWRRHPWGYVLAVVTNIKGALYALVLAAGSYVAANEGFAGLAEQIPIWLVLSAASTACLVLLLIHLKPGSEQPEEASRTLKRA